MSRKPIPATVIEVNDDQPFKDGLGNRKIRRGQIIVKQHDGLRQVFFRGTGQIPEDVKVGDEGVVSWIDRPGAFYPIFGRRI